MLPATNYTILCELAERYIGLGQRVLERGAQVIPVAVAIKPNGETAVWSLVGPSTSQQRAEVLRQLVSTTGADGILFFGDTNIRDPQTMLKVGDMLHGYIEMKDGTRAQRLCRYTTDPLTFGAIERLENAGAWAEPIWDRHVH